MKNFTMSLLKIHSIFILNNSKILIDDNEINLKINFFHKPSSLITKTFHRKNAEFERYK